MEELRAMLPESGPTHPQDMLEQIFDIVRHLRRQTTVLAAYCAYLYKRS